MLRRLHYGVALVAALLASTPAEIAAQASACEGGREITARTAGRCCWPGQSWSRSLGRCVGEPHCPAGTTRHESTCAPLAATTCAEGREVSAQTAGRCCWPGQSWNRVDAACEGPPRCPPPLVEDGDDCIAAGGGAAGGGAATAPLPPTATPPITTVAATARARAAPAPATRRHPTASSTHARDFGSATRERETSSILWLQITGALTWVTAYLTGIGVTAAVGGSASEMAILAIPFAGPWMCLAGSCRSPASYAAGLVADGLVQVAGLVLFIVGSALQVEVTPSNLAILPWGGPDGGGALVLTRF